MQLREDKKIAPTKAVVAAYWKHVVNYKWYVLGAVFCIVLIQVGTIIGPLFLRQLVNALASGVSPESTGLAVQALIWYSVLQAAVWAMWRVEMLTSTQACARIMADLSKEAFAYLIRHSYQFFTNSFAGALTRRVGRYSDSFNKLWDSLIESVLGAMLYTFGVIGVLWFQHPTLGASLAAAVVLFIALQWALSRWQQPLRTIRAEEDSNLTAALADSIANQNNVQLFSANAFEEKGVGTAVERLLQAYLKTWNFDVYVYGLLGFFSTTINISILWVAFWLWTQGLITIGDFVLIQVYIIGLFNNVWGLSREFRNINTAFADAGEMVHIMQQPHDVKDIPNAKVLNVSQGVIWFDDVSFSFHDKLVLDKFNLTIEHGQKIALVGSSGAGKSTITKLLLRLYDVGSGRILIDKQDAALVTQDSLRQAIGFVPQEPVLFHRTLIDNIRYGRLDASDAEVFEAAKLAHCHEFISKLPLGYKTFVGERGIKLSGGERQRVAIARAILKNAPILVLDEATSSLDSESESLIQDALSTLMQGKTVIVIAHRLSTIMRMDKIIVVDEGKVVASGTHLELLNQDGLYKKLWSIQAGGFIADDGSGVETEKKEESKEFAEE